MKKILTIYCFLAVLTTSYGQVSEGQPIPETAMELALNQYSHLCINTSDQTINYTPETNLRLGKLGYNFLEYSLMEELDHFSINLAPLGTTNDANLRLELQVEDEIFGFTYNGYGTLQDLDGNAIPGATVTSGKEPITLGVDDGMLILEINGGFVFSQELSGGLDDVLIRLSAINAEDDCFWFYLDAAYRRPTNYVNFTEDKIFVEEGGKANVCIDLTNVNITENAKVGFEFSSSKLPHFEQYVPKQIDIPYGELGPFCFEISTDMNLVRDENSDYKLELEVLSGANLEIGDNNTLDISVIDDVISQSTNLQPGDLMFTGFDNDIGNGEDQIVFTNMVELTNGTSFQLTNAAYRASLDLFYRSGFRGNYSSVKFVYQGDDPLPPGSTFCVFTGINYDNPDSHVERIELDGNDATPLFSIENVGVRVGNSIELNTTSSKSLFLLQGQWSYGNSLSGRLNGKVLSGIHIGGLWSASEFPADGFSNEHPDLECIGIQGPATEGNHWGYYSCESPFTLSELEFKAEVAEFSNWNTGADGANINSLPADICAGTCEIVDDHIALKWITLPQDITIECDGSPDPSGAIEQWINSLGGGEYEGSCANIQTSSASGLIDGRMCTTNEISFTVIATNCNEEISAVASVTVSDNTAPDFAGIPPSITMNCTDNFAWDQSNVSDICTPTEEIDVVITEDLISSTGTEDIYEIIYTATDACGNESSYSQERVFMNSSLTVNISGADNRVLCQDIVSHTHSYSFGISFSANVSGNQGDVSYNWQYYDVNGALLYSSAESILSLIDRDRPTGTIIVTVSDGNCSASDEINVIGSEFSLGESNLNLDVCPGASINLVPMPTGGEGDITYEWRDASTNQIISEEEVLIVDSNLPIPYTIRLVARDERGCIAAQRWQVRIYDHELEFYEGDVYCPGDRVRLGVDLSGFSNDVSYAWYNGMEYLSAQESPREFVYETTTFRVVVTDNVTGCILEGTYTVYINEPRIGIDEQYYFCGETASFTFSPSIHGGTSPFEFTWLRKNPPNGYYTVISNTLNLVQTNLDISVPREYRFRVEDDNGCTDIQDITVNRVPDISLETTLNNHTLVDGATTQVIDCEYFDLIAEATGGYGEITYTWFDEEGDEIYSGTQVNHKLSISSSLTLEVSNVSGCAATQTYHFTGSGIDVEVGSTQLDGIYGCVGEVITLSNLISIDESLVATYQWKDGGYPISGATNPTYDHLIRGDNNRITLTITDIHGCVYTNTISIQRISCQSFNENVATRSDLENRVSSFRIFPNPATTFFTVSFTSLKEQKGDMQIYSTSGQLLEIRTVEFVVGKNDYKVNSLDLLSGMYLIRLKTESGDYVEKLVISN